MIVKAIRALRPNAQWAVGKNYDSLEWLDTEQTKPSQEEIQVKIAELTAAEPMRLLKEERNRRIAESDWRFLSDQTPSQAWIDYRQALRDLPANSIPELDENDNLINVNWPVEPTE
jgi:hypothetical protein